MEVNRAQIVCQSSDAPRNPIDMKELKFFFKKAHATNLCFHGYSSENFGQIPQKYHILSLKSQNTANIFRKPLHKNESIIFPSTPPESNFSVGSMDSG